MATFDTIKPELKAYLLKHRLPDIFEVIFLPYLIRAIPCENFFHKIQKTLLSRVCSFQESNPHSPSLQCIFTGLAASRPDDPNQFILTKLREYQAGKHFDLEWDSFVNKQNLPAERVFKKSFIENFFTLDDLAKMVRYPALLAFSGNSVL